MIVIIYDREYVANTKDWPAIDEFFENKNACTQDTRKIQITVC